MKNFYYFLGSILLLVNTFPIIASANADFEDVPITHKYYEAIDYVKENNIVQGYPDGTFKPDNNINRAEFTKIIIASKFDAENIIDKCIAKNYQNSNNISFSDVKKSEWYSKYVCVAKEYSIIQGYNDNTFGGSNNINFAEGLKILLTTFEKNVDEYGGNQWYSKYINFAKEFGLPLADSKQPSDFLTRGEMAMMIFWIKLLPTLDEDSGDENFMKFDLEMEDETLTYYITDAEIQMIQADPERGYIYAVSKKYNAFYIIDSTSRKIVKKISVGSKPISFAFDKENKNAYVATSGKNAMTIIDLDKQEKKEEIALSIKPYQIALTSKYIYVTHADDQWGKGVVVDLQTNEEVASFGTGANSFLYEGAHLAISEDENYLYVGSARLSPANIYKYSIKEQTPEFILQTDHGSIGSNLKDMILDKSGNNLYVACGSPYEIQIIRTSDLKSNGSLETGPYPTAISIYEKSNLGFAAHATSDVMVFDLENNTLLNEIPFDFSDLNEEIQDKGLFISEEKDLIFILVNTSYEDENVQLVLIANIKEGDFRS